MLYNSTFHFKFKAKVKKKVNEKRGTSLILNKQYESLDRKLL